MENNMIGDRIRRKRLASGMSLQNLVDMLAGNGVHLSKAALSNYETNKTLPNAKTLWALANAFRVSMEYFIHEQPTSLVLNGYRKRAGLSVARHDQIIAIVQDEIEKRAEIERILSVEQAVDLPRRKTIGDAAEAEQIAAKVRKDWGLGDHPIASVTALLEEQGWYVIQSPSEEDFDGLSGFVKPQNRPFAVSRRGISIDRMRLNLLHEVGHAYIECSDEKISEKAAFRFASALLLPKSRVLEEIGRSRSSFTLNELILLKKKYGVSIQAMAFRFRDLGVISQSYFSLFFTWINQQGFKVQEPGSEQLTFQEESTVFRAHVLRALSEGMISESEFSRFLPGLPFPDASTGFGSSTEIKRLLSLPKEEREKVLEAAASAAVEAYKSTEVNLGDLVDEAKEYT
jgi:Zn-dependent peptidase ImmA (M78 family)